MMNSCKVFVINESLSREDVRFAAKPKAQLRAVPYGSTTKQVVQAGESPVVFSVYDASTSVLADITGTAIFLNVRKGDESVEIKGKVNSDIKGLVSFDVTGLDNGFYSYEVVVRANNYSQTLLSGSYVVKKP
jgi:hypothetical protein